MSFSSPQSSPRLAALPFLIAGALLAKKVAIFTLAKSYGFPRVYRRVLELERKIYGKPESVPHSSSSSSSFSSSSSSSSLSLRSVFKVALRSPDKAFHLISNHPSALTLIAAARQVGVKGFSPQSVERLFAQLQGIFSAAGLDLSQVLARARAVVPPASPSSPASSSSPSSSSPLSSSSSSQQPNSSSSSKPSSL